MSNIHGLSSNPGRPNRSNRAQQIQGSDSGLSMLGITSQDLSLLHQQVTSNSIPFINIMTDSTHPLDESIPYTLKLVWCPAFRIYSFSMLALAVMWAMYVVCLCEGIDSTRYQVLAPDNQSLRKYGAYNYQLLKDGQVWRLIAASFLHQDLLQITMSTLSMLFFVTQLEQCYNPLYMGALMLLASVAGNITTAVFGNLVQLYAGAAPMIYGALGGLLAYLLINWQVLVLIRGQLGCMTGMLLFFAMLFSIGSTYGFGGFCGGVFGGLCAGLMVLPGIRPKSIYLSLLGVAGLAVYFLTMFLIFYLAV